MLTKLLQYPANVCIFFSTIFIEIFFQFRETFVVNMIQFSFWIKKKFFLIFEKL